MNQTVYSIYDAKTNLSKLIEKAKNGSPSYVGAYGKPEAMIIPIPKKKNIVFGLLADKKNEEHKSEEDILATPEDLIDLMENGPIFPS